MSRVSLAMLLVLCGCRSQIQHGLDERDANEVLSALLAQGFDATKVPEKGKRPTWAIEVDDERANDALRLLVELKLPRAPRTTTRELVGQTSLVETAQAERLRQLEAQEGDLEQSLEALDGVTSAAVELVVPPPARPGQPPVTSKASVLLRVHSEAAERLLTQRQELKALVAGAVDGLRVDDVVLVVDTVTAPSAPAAAATEPGLRALAAVLAALLSLCCVGLVLLARRVRRSTGTAPAPAVITGEKPPSSAPPTPKPLSGNRPVLNPAAARKAVAS